MRRMIAICLAILAPAVAMASPVTGEWVQTEHTRARLIAPEVVAEGRGFPLAVEVELQPEWHTYWINPGDSGIPTRVKPTLPERWTAEPLQFPIPHRFEMEGLLNYGYTDHVTFLLPIMPANFSEGQTATISAELKMLVCKDVCVPENAALEITVTGGDAASAHAALTVEPFASAERVIPQSEIPNGLIALDGAKLQFSLPYNKLPASVLDAKSWDLFIQDQGVTGLEKPTRTNDTKQLLLSLNTGTAEVSGRITGLLVAETESGPQSWYVQYMKADGAIATVADGGAASTELAPPASAPAQSFLVVLLFALLGGLILNAMPCVFPVLSLKALALAKKAESEHATIRAHGFAYTAGVLLCFVGLGVLMLTLQSAGRQIGWGFQLQSPGFVAAMCGLFFLLGLNLIGAFEFPLLGGNLRLNGKESSKGSFLTGLLAALVATPCTAPFMGSAMGAAIGLPAFQAVLVFVALGLGMALPFLLLSFFPRLARCLPKPGLWMQRLKEILAFPMLGAALWLFWVLAQQVGPMGLAWALASLLLLALGVWGWRLVQFSSPAKRWGWLLMVAVLWGIAVHGLAHDPVMPAVPAENGQIDYVLPNAEKYSAARLIELQRDSRPVFIDATAAWCLTCKVNERGALSSDAVRALFAKYNIAVLVADWTNEDPAITALLKSFGRNGVPIYAFYPGDGSAPRLLPQLLTPSNIQEGIEGTRTENH